MLAHGLVSSGLFAGVNIIYDQTHSRSLVVNKGILRNAPSLLYTHAVYIVLCVVCIHDSERFETTMSAANLGSVPVLA
jgi:NADH:ubiquinone oxidoreductase subunit 4 (subunit M)